MPCDLRLYLATGLENVRAVWDNQRAARRNPSRVVGAPQPGFLVHQSALPEGDVTSL